MEKQFPVKFCEQCEGSGREIRDYHGNPLAIQKTYGSGDFEVFIDKAYDPTTCTVCNGYAVISKSSHSRYKSAANAKRMKDAGKSIKCFHCDDNGMTWKIPAVQKCWTCGGSGFKLVFDKDATVIPEVIDIYGYPTQDFRAAWVDNVEIIVNRTVGELSWGESFLGIGSIWSCTDYGEHWEMTDEEVINDIRSKLASDSYQLISICDKSTRQIAKIVEVKLRNQGYSLIAVGKKYNDHALPPTYMGIVDLPVSTANYIINQ